MRSSGLPRDGGREPARIRLDQILARREVLKAIRAARIRHRRQTQLRRARIKRDDCARNTGALRVNHATTDGSDCVCRSGLCERDRHP